MAAAFIPSPRQADGLVTVLADGLAGGERVWPEHLDRPLVDELISRATSGRICAVIAAAGWGKTTAVATWSQGRRTGWLRFAKREDSAEHVLGYLAEVLRAHLPGPMSGRMSGHMSGLAPIEDVAAFCAWLRRSLRGELVLVLDDLHELSPGSGGAEVVEGLCRHAPDRLTLVLISRCKLPFSLQRLRGRGLVSEISAHDLAFDITDIDSLLRKTVGREPPGLAARVWERTGGWPAAVHCVLEMLRGTTSEQRLAAVRRLATPGERFHDYLAEEVIGTAPERTRWLLHQLALIGEISSGTELAAGTELAGETSTASGLLELGRQGLVRRGGPHETWSLVPALRDYFEHTSPPGDHERNAARRRAAEDCLARGAPAGALRHRLAAGDHASCAALLVDHGDAMVERGQLDTVLAAAALPDEHLADPRVHHVLGLAHQLRGQWAPALAHLRRAGHDGGELEPALAWRLGGAAFARGELAELRSVIQRTRLAGQDTLDETRVLALAASAEWLSGDLRGLRERARQTGEAARHCGDPLASCLAHQVSALLAAAQGDGREAGVHFAAASREAEASASPLQLSWIRACQAHYHFEAGAPQQALAQAQLAASLGERCGSPFLIAQSLTARARARTRLGALEAAAGDFATAIDLYQRLGSRWLAWPLSGLGDLHRSRGQPVRARAAYEEALSLAKPHHDVFGLTSALVGLARIEAADDPLRARKLAEEAMDLGTGFRQVPAVLTHGWVALMDGDRHRAAADAEAAATAAREHRDHPGLAEAITLGVLSCRDPATRASALRESIEIWQEAGCRLEEATARIVASRLGAAVPHLDTSRAEQVLRDYGVDSRQVAGPLNVLVRSAPALSIQTLGVFRVIRDGVPIPNTAWQSKKARDLLKILVARRRPTPREQLMELLWPGVDPNLASNRLSVLLSTVRDVLQPQPSGDAALITADGAVSLNRNLVSVDVDEFLAIASGALDAYRSGEADAIQRLLAAIATYTGDFLENDPYQEWASTISEEARAAHIALLRALTVRLREAGATDDAVRYALRLLEQDRYDEEAYRALIGILSEAGRLGEARRHHQRYVRRMAEIDVRPTPLRDMARSGGVAELRH